MHSIWFLECNFSYYWQTWCVGISTKQTSLLFAGVWNHSFKRFSASLTSLHTVVNMTENTDSSFGFCNSVYFSDSQFVRVIFSTSTRKRFSNEKHKH